MKKAILCFAIALICAAPAKAWPARPPGYVSPNRGDWSEWWNGVRENAGNAWEGLKVSFRLHLH